MCFCSYFGENFPKFCLGKLKIKNISRNLLFFDNWKICDEMFSDQILVKIWQSPFLWFQTLSELFIFFWRKNHNCVFSLFQKCYELFIHFEKKKNRNILKYCFFRSPYLFLEKLKIKNNFFVDSKHFREKKKFKKSGRF